LAASLGARIEDVDDELARARAAAGAACVSAAEVVAQLQQMHLRLPAAQTLLFSSSGVCGTVA